jgi:hypothetical protein
VPPILRYASMVWYSRVGSQNFTRGRFSHSNGANKKGRVVLAVPLLDNFSWILGMEFDTPGNFWGVENPPADWQA